MHRDHLVFAKACQTAVSRSNRLLVREDRCSLDPTGGPFPHVATESNEEPKAGAPSPGFVQGMAYWYREVVGSLSRHRSDVHQFESLWARFLGKWCHWGDLAGIKERWCHSGRWLQVLVADLVRIDGA